MQRQIAVPSSISVHRQTQQNAMISLRIVRAADPYDECPLSGKPDIEADIAE
jgi:hypothetical protein